MTSDQPRIELSFELTLSDALATQRSVFFSSTPGRAMSIGAVVVLVSALALGAWFLALAVGLWLVLMGSWMFYFVPRKSFLSDPNLQGRQRWTIGSDGLSFETTAPDGTQLAVGDRDWRSVARTLESSKAFVLYTAPRQVSALPKRAMTPSQVDELRALVAANVTTGSS